MMLLYPTLILHPLSSTPFLPPLFTPSTFFFFVQLCPPVEDLERNDGSPERPYLMSDNLLKVLKKKNSSGEAQ